MSWDERIPPLRAALIQPVDRNETYSASALYSAALVRELLPEIGKRIRHGARIGIGASLGALAMLHAHIRHPGTFDGLLLQSGSFFRQRFDKQEAGFQRYRRITRFVGTVLRRAGEALLRAVVRQRELDAPRPAARGARPETRPLRVVGALAARAVRAGRLPRARGDRDRLLVRRLPRGELLPQARRLVPALHLHERRLRRFGPGRRRPRRRRLLQQPNGLRLAPARRPPRLAASPGLAAPGLRAGPVGGRDRRARLDAAVRLPARRAGQPGRAPPVGRRRAERIAVMAQPDRSSSTTSCLS